jgi:hypothetical protein
MQKTLALQQNELGQVIRRGSIVVVFGQLPGPTVFDHMTGMVVDPHHKGSPCDGPVAVVFPKNWVPESFFGHLARANEWRIKDNEEWLYNSDPSVICFQADDLRVMNYPIHRHTRRECLSAYLDYVKLRGRRKPKVSLTPAADETQGLLQF